MTTPSRRLSALGVALTLLLLPAAPHTAVADGHDPTVDPVAVDDPLRHLQWYLDRIRAPQAWATTTGDPDITIAVVDTGVDPRHRDLEDAFWRHPETGAIGYDHLRDSHTTYVGPVEDWHGTAVAGVAAARSDDGYGIAGVAPDVRVMVRRIYRSTAEDEPPTHTSSSLGAAAIRAAAEDGADVILVTWGGTTPSSELFTAIEGAGVPVVAAAGNDGQDLSGSPSVRRYPAFYRLPNLVTVAATDRDNRIVEHEDGGGSNYGERHVDLAAPGVDIVSLAAGADHAVFEGTSFAAPQVAGALALGRVVAPGISANELVAWVVRTARRHSSLQGRVTSSGVLDTAAFLRALQRPVCTADIPPSTFSDVDRRSAHVGNIDCVAWYRVTSGVGDDRFAPDRTITRGEMATFLAHVLELADHDLPDDAPAAFTDTDGSVHARSIDVLAELGIVAGVGGDRFEPRGTVTREQMATFLVRTMEVLLDAELDAELEWFDDVDGSVHRDAILVVGELGIAIGSTEPREYLPALGTTRGQMASFVARTLDSLGRQGVTFERDG